MLLAHLSTALILVSTALGQVWPSQSYKTEPFTPPDLSINTTGNAADGYLFFGPVGNGTTSQAPLIMNNANDLIWQGPNGTPNNLRVQMLKGKPVLTFWSGYGALASTFGHGYGHVAILDDTYKVAYNICMSDLNLVTPNATVYPGTTTPACLLDNHESLITSRNTLIATAFNVTNYDLSSVGGPVNGWIFDALFYEIDIETNEVLFQWSALKNIPISQSNYVNLTGPLSNRLNINGVTYGLSQALPWDYFHINSVQPVDGGYIVNSRYTWSLYQVNATTGAVEWRLEGSNGADFSLGPGIFFSWQHMPRLFHNTPNSFKVHLFDNDNVAGLAQGVNQTSGLVLLVDKNTKDVTLLRKLVSPDKLYSVAQGSVQELADGHILMGYGTNAHIIEYDETGNQIFDAQFGNETPGVSTVTNYRAYRYGWSAKPHYRPKVYATSSSGVTTVYASWNGATDYDGWVLYGGDTPDAARKTKVGRVKRTGFETSYQIQGSHKFILAQAAQGSTRLSRSKVFATIEE